MVRIQRKDALRLNSRVYPRIFIWGAKHTTFYIKLEDETAALEEEYPLTQKFLVGSVEILGSLR